MYAEGPIKNALNRNTYIAHRKCRIFHNVDCKACHQAGVAGQQFPRPVLPPGTIDNNLFKLWPGWHGV